MSLSGIDEYVKLLSDRKSGIKQKRNYPLSMMTTFKIGGPAGIAVFPVTEEELLCALDAAKAADVRYAVIGRGSNLLVSDAGFDGVIIGTDELKAISVSGNTVTAQCGATLYSVAGAALAASLSGGEFMYGIPGSVGGAVYMNAGAYNGQMSDIVKKTVYYDTESGDKVTIDAAQHGFSYRKSVFSKDGSKVILETTMELVPGDANEIRELMDSRMRRRIEKQPLDMPSAGSTFKRYDGFYTAELIDKAGLRGKRIGGAQVSEKHAGFIVNAGGATACDVLSLIELIKKEIKQNNGVDIECEVEYLE